MLLSLINVLIYIYTDFEGNIPLCEAIKEGHESMIKLLMDNGADISSADVASLACFAVEKNNIQLLKDLVKYGGDIVTKSKDNGTTALHTAVCHGNVEIVKFLVEQGADIDKPDGIGWSSRAYANQQCHEEIQNMFKEIEQDNTIPYDIPSTPDDNRGPFIEKCHSEPSIQKCQSKPSMLAIPQHGMFPPNQELTWLDSPQKRKVSPFRNSFFGMIAAANRGKYMCRYLPSSIFNR